MSKKCQKGAMTDEEILQLARHPNTKEKGFRLLVSAYQQRLYQHIRRQLPTHEDTDDVLQNTFLKIFRHLEVFEGRSGLYTWMYRIAQNEIFDHHKKMKRNQTIDLTAIPESAADHYVNMEALVPSLETAIRSLPERQQTVFRMRYYDELSYKQIAEVLQVTEGALKASFHHAVKKIEESIRQQS